VAIVTVSIVGWITSMAFGQAMGHAVDHSHGRETNMQVWIITNKGYFVSAYSAREKAYDALARLKDRGIVGQTATVRAWTLDQVVN
jgi:hypothetical protein